MTSLPLMQPTPGPGARPPRAPEHAQRGEHLVDSHGRVIRDVRVSVTDRCNFRCVYCMDPDFRYMGKQELLSLDEYESLTRVFATLGVRKMRITGGEPTLYSELDQFIAGVASLGFADVSMTTNGSLMTPDKARRWRQLGLHRVTLSLDSLREDRVRSITRARTSPQDVIDAIHTARQAGLDPIKVNAVIVRGVNDDELPDFADFAREHSIDMRLIEFMPLDSQHAWSRGSVVSADEMITRIGERHELVPANGEHASSTSSNFTFKDGAPGRIGVIAPVTRPFCGACSRLRVTADGKVRPCLFSHDEWDVRAVLRAGATDDQLREFLVDATWTKQSGHGISAKDFVQPRRTMSAIGG